MQPYFVPNPGLPTPKEPQNPQMVTTTELKGIPVHQKVTGSLLARDAVEYEIPANTLTTPRLY